MGFAGAMDQGPSIYVGALEQGPCRWGFVGGRGIGAGALQLQVGRAAGMQVVRRGHSLYSTLSNEIYNPPIPMQSRE